LQSDTLSLPTTSTVSDLKSDTCLAVERWRRCPTRSRTPVWPSSVDGGVRLGVGHL